MRKWQQLSHVQLGCCVTRGVCTVRKGVAGQPGGTQPLPNHCARPRWILWQGLMLFPFEECFGMLRFGDTCRTSTFLYRLGEREHTNEEWPPGRSPRLQEAAKPPEMMGKKENHYFPKVHEGIPWSLFGQETIKTYWTKRQKGLCKEKGLFPNTPLYLSHPAVVFSCSKRSQLQRMKTFL